MLPVPSQDKGGGLSTPCKNLVVQKPNETSQMDQTTQPRREHGINLGTWNVLSMTRVGTLRKVKEELRKYKIAIASLQEIRWKGKGMMKSEDFTVFTVAHMITSLVQGSWCI
jgi:hypothetical protein